MEPTIDKKQSTAVTEPGSGIENLAKVVPSAVDAKLLGRIREVVGRKVRVWWPRDDQYFSGKVVGLSSPRHGGTHDVKYEPDDYGENDEPISENLFGYGTKGDQVEWEFDS